MGDFIAFPMTDMIRTAQEIRAILDTQWSKHVLHYSSFTGLIAAISSGLPAGQRQGVQDQAEQWQRQMQKQYASLYALADALEKGSINATEAEVSISHLFTTDAELI